MRRSLSAGGASATRITTNGWTNEADPCATKRDEKHAAKYAFNHAARDGE
jgi:hypothetical protein